MVRWLRWHCPPDTGFEIRALAVWGRERYLSVTEAPRNTDFHTWMGKKHFCFFQTAESGNRTPNSGVKGSGANHYPRAPALSSERKKGLMIFASDYCVCMCVHNNVDLKYLKYLHQTSQQRRYIHPMLFQCWTSVVGPTLKQRWINVSCLIYTKLTREGVQVIFNSKQFIWWTIYNQIHAINKLSKL